jgi:hypothetical protein
MTAVDLDRLFKLRLAVARIGEMDNARWWNTKAQLGPVGGMALSRGFPRTHRFAQARSVFAVAAARCAEVFDPPGCMTLWRLPASLEDGFDARWEHFIEQQEAFLPVFSKVEQAKGAGLRELLLDLKLVTDADDAAVKAMKVSAEGRALQVPGVHAPTDEVLGRLALGFCKSQPAALAVPYARLEA